MASWFISYVRQLAYGVANVLTKPITMFQQYYSSSPTLHKNIGDRPADPAWSTTTATAKCRYKLEDDSSAIATLSDGRQICYALYGQPEGCPIFALHGLPGSRLDGVYLDMLAAKSGVRIISVDRPGIGRSSPNPNATVLSHANDVGQLAELLGLDSYGVLGTSGGGPYALACAACLPADRLRVVSVVCGLGPPEVGKKGMSWTNWAGFAIGYRYFPGFVRWWFSREPWARFELSDEERLEILQKEFEKSKPKLHPKDVAVFGDVDMKRAFLRSSREFFRQGFNGFLQDGKLISMDFGFRLEEIRSDIPIHLWYGKLDTNVPPGHGEQIAARLGPRARLMMVDETHASVSANYWEPALQRMVALM